MTKETPWHSKLLMEKVSAILYPALTTDENRRQMAEISSANGKLSPQQAKEQDMRSQSTMGVAVRTKR